MLEGATGVRDRWSGGARVVVAAIDAERCITFVKGSFWAPGPWVLFSPAFVVRTARSGEYGAPLVRRNEICVLIGRGGARLCCLNVPVASLSTLRRA